MSSNDYSVWRREDLDRALEALALLTRIRKERPELWRLILGVIAEFRSTDAKAS